jgi:hypothetical protein
MGCGRRFLETTLKAYSAACELRSAWVAAGRQAGLGSINDGRAAFALAHIAPEAESLTEGEPALRREAMLDDRAQRISTLIPEYPRPVAAFFGMASGAETLLDPHG